MKRQNKKQRRSKKNRKHANTSNSESNANTAKIDRRDMLAKLRNWSFLGVLTLGTAWYLVDQVTASIKEHDLSLIGNGTPAIVQIHDPQCPKCQALQSETRKALSRFEDGEYQYLVANIATNKGRDFAAEHGVAHITLVLFDGKGKRQQVLEGNNSSDFLASVFTSHLRGFGEKRTGSH